ncbi:MAG: restriction endonuclease subunit S [Chloroflexota bacterium]
MKWNKVQLYDVLQLSEIYISLLDLSQYKYATLSPYPHGLLLEGKKMGADFRGKQHQIARAGQFVISSLGMDQHLWGIVPPELDEAVIHRSYACFNIHQDININYFAAYLTTKQFSADVSAARTRAGQLFMMQFTNIRMPNPPPEEQQQIAEIWKYTGSALHHTAEEYSTIVELKSDVATELFRNISSTVESKALASWATIGCDEAVEYPVYMTANGQPRKERPQLSDAVIGIMPNTEMDGQFLYYYLENQKQLQKTSNNLPQHSLERAIETLPVALPTLYEQRKIATLLHQHDDALHKLEVEQNELQYLTQGVMELVFSGELPSEEALRLLQNS